MSIVSEHRRKQRIKTAWHTFLWIGHYALPILGVAVALALSAWGIGTWVRSNDNDYAGYGPNRVTIHNYRAIGNWLGNGAKELSRKESRFGSHSAWATQYLLDGKKICVYVWGGSNTAAQEAVTKGACA